MGNFTEIQNEFNLRLKIALQPYLNECSNNHIPPDNNRIIDIQQNTINAFRMESIQKLAAHTKRNIICYYSTWLQGNQNNPNPEVMINDNDINGFMNAISKMDKNKGLDLVLHTPGGVTTATECLVKYIRKIFKLNINVIVPQLAMSAGTLIACSAKKIFMGKESSLGPVDPQYHNVPAQGVIKEFNRAMDETCTIPNRSLIWREIIRQYRPSFIGECENVVKLTEDLLQDWLSSCMLKYSKNKEKKIEIIKNELIDHDASKVHDRHYDFNKCKKIGLNVKALEDDPILQDLVLSVHHTYLLSAYVIPTSIKFIESNIGNSFIINGKR